MKGRYEMKANIKIGKMMTAYNDMVQFEENNKWRMNYPDKIDGYKQKYDEKRSAFLGTIDVLQKEIDEVQKKSRIRWGPGIIIY